MNSPDPDEEPEALKRLIARGGQIRPLDDRLRAALLARIRQRAAQADAPARRTGAALGLALGALGALGGIAALRIPNEPEHDAQAPRTTSAATAQTAPSTPRAASAPAARRLSLGGRGEIVLAEGAVARIPPSLQAGGTGPTQLALDRGRLTASVGPRRHEEPLSIVTPHVAVVVIGTRFSVAVEGDHTTVAVEHGRVRVDRGDRSVFVDGGDALQSDDPRLTQQPEASAKSSSAPCADAPHRRRCLREIARGRGLAAQNAVFALALHERDQRRDPEAALSLLRAYVRRFPRGVLMQDAVLAAARILRDAGREPEACALVGRHAARFPAPHALSAWLSSDCAEGAAARPTSARSGTEVH